MPLLRTLFQRSSSAKFKHRGGGILAAAGMNISAASHIAVTGRGDRVLDGIAVVSGSVVCFLLAGYGGIRFDDPLSFVGDHLYALGSVRSVLGGNFFRFDDSLGYPAARDNLYFPTFYFSQKLIVLILSNFLTNPFSIIIGLYLISIGLIYSFCYWGLRTLGIKYWIAWIGSIAFVISPYFSSRAALHDSLSFFYTVPLGAALSLHIGLSERQEAADGLRRFLANPFNIAAILFLGMSGVYYAAFAVLFVCFVGAATSMSLRSATPILQALVVSGAVLVLLLVSGLGLGLIDILGGSVPVTERSPLMQPLYGLFIGDFAATLAQIPLFHSGYEIIKSLDQWRQESTWGEWPGLLLSLVILGSPLILLATWPRDRESAHEIRRRLIVLCAGCILVGILFATRGGIGLLFNVYVTPLIRAQTRIMPFLTFFALVIVLTWIELALTAKERWVQIALPVVLVAFLLSSVTPSVGFLLLKQRAFLASSADRSDKLAIEALLERMHEVNTRRVLQLPLSPWPEAPGLNGFDPYRFELPYILDKPGSKIRWSYGLASAQPAFHYLSALVDFYRENGLAAGAKAMGFDSILLESTAFDAAGLAAWTNAIEADLLADCKVVEDKYRTLYLLTRASGSKRACLGGKNARSPVTALRFDVNATGSGRHLLLEGWLAPEQSLAWSDGPAPRFIVPLPPARRADRLVEVTLEFDVVFQDLMKSERVTFGFDEALGDTMEIRLTESKRHAATLRIRGHRMGANRYLDVVIFIRQADDPPSDGVLDKRRRGIGLRRVESRENL